MDMLCLEIPLSWCPNLLISRRSMCGSLSDKFLAGSYLYAVVLILVCYVNIQLVISEKQSQASFQL